MPRCLLSTQFVLLIASADCNDRIRADADAPRPGRRCRSGRFGAAPVEAPEVPALPGDRERQRGSDRRARVVPSGHLGVATGLPTNRQSRFAGQRIGWADSARLRPLAWIARLQTRSYPAWLQRPAKRVPDRAEAATATPRSLSREGRRMRSLFCVAVVVVLLATCGEVAVAASDQLPYGELIATLWKPGRAMSGSVCPSGGSRPAGGCRRGRRGPRRGGR